MAVSNVQPLTLSTTASGDLSGDQYCVAMYIGERQVQLATSAVSTGLAGILQTKPQNGEDATLVVLGVSKGRAAGSVTANVYVTTNGSGRITAAASGNYVIGRALEAAGAAGDLITVLVTPAWRIGAV